MAHYEIPEKTVLGYNDISVGTTAVSLPTAPVNADGNPASTCFIQVQRATVRVRMDGGTPTGSSGLMLAAGDMIEIRTPENYRGTRFISDGGQAVTLSVTWLL